jgi:TRAP-type C4-dicarboxylate transport system permease small subunit
MHRLIDSFEAGFTRLLAFLAALTALSIALIAIGIPLNLLLVKMQWGSIWWMYEAVEYALYVGVFIAAPWVLRQGAHVRVDVAVAALPARLSLRLEQALDVAGVLLCLLLCFYGIRAAISEFQDGTLPDKDLRIANWYMLAVFALSFLLLAIEFALRLRRVGGETGPGSPERSGF